MTAKSGSRLWLIEKEGAGGAWAMVSVSTTNGHALKTARKLAWQGGTYRVCRFDYMAVAATIVGPKVWRKPVQQTFADAPHHPPVQAELPAPPTAATEPVVTTPAGMPESSESSEGEPF